MTDETKLLPCNLLEVAGKVHIITGPNGQCMCGIYGGHALICLQIIATVSHEFNSAMVAEDIKAIGTRTTRQPSEEVEQVLRDGVSVIEEIRNQALICKNTEPPQMCWVNSEWLAHAATSLLSKINALLAKKGGGQ